MWLTNSSIGRKVVMSVTGLALILFLTFHACMNVVALFSAEAYNAICAFLGANWYAVVATAALAALVALHFIFAIILTLQNRKARGGSNYAVSTKVVAGKVEWASKNMFVLGIIVCLGLLLHLYNFWYNMMFAELVGVEGPLSPTDGYAFIVQTFSCPVYAGLYIVWLVALWFHLSHGMWSAFQTLGASGKTWLPRVKAISIVWSTVVILMFIVVVVYFALGFGCECSAACGDGCAQVAACGSAC
ncbi:MAG: succinate dehydrogenase/fumarate reductase cytochrome b subunit [Bacteroidales bacterium]|nr:succinate dehydrogenase/fumarate reductase cytochrome b subunit [Bacteroidales bacterium]